MRGKEEEEESGDDIKEIAMPSPQVIFFPPNTRSSTSSPFGSRSYPDVHVLSGGTARLACNVTSSSDEPVTLILWYKSGNGTGPPFYTVDARNTTLSSFPSNSNSMITQHQQILQQAKLMNNYNKHLLRATHFIGSNWKDRVSFNLSVQPPILSIREVRQEDSSDYSCRVSRMN